MECTRGNERTILAEWIKADAYRDWIIAEGERSDNDTVVPARWTFVRER